MVNNLIELFILVPIETITILLICDFLQFKKLNFKKNITPICFMSLLNFLLQRIPEQIDDPMISSVLITLVPIIGIYVYYKISKIYKLKICIMATFISLVFCMLCLLPLNIISNNGFFILTQTNLIVNLLFNIIYRILLIFIISLKIKRCKYD